MVLEKLDSHMHKNEIGPLCYTIIQKSTQNELRFEQKIWNYKLQKENIGVSSLTLILATILGVWQQN